MLLNQESCLLLIIDIQEKLLNAVFNKEDVEKHSVIMSKACCSLNIPVVVTEQYPKGLGNTIPEIKDNSSNCEVFEKTSFNALLEPDINNAVTSAGRKQIIVMGIETHICVHQTVNALIEKGYDVTVVSDACGSRAEKEYLSALDVMKTNGAKIKTTEMILFELLKSAKHSNFKEIQGLIK